MHSVEPICSPLDDAPQICVNAFAPVRCWAFNPGSSLPALMLKTRTSRLSTAARAREVRRTCPPPSPMLPSISIIFHLRFTLFFKLSVRCTSLEYEEVSTIDREVGGDGIRLSR